VKKRAFLDECCSEDELEACFPRKAHVYRAEDFGVRGKEDPTVIDYALRRGCLVITVNKDFVDYYRNHARRKGRSGAFFYGLIFLKPSKIMSRQAQLRAALREMDWVQTRQHDDLVIVSGDGRTKHERLCHPDCAAAFPTDQREWS
jgi:hypothetical protein